MAHTLWLNCLTQPENVDAQIDLTRSPDRGIDPREWLKWIVQVHLFGLQRWTARVPDRLGVLHPVVLVWATHRIRLDSFVTQSSEVLRLNEVTAQDGLFVCLAYEYLSLKYFQDSVALKFESADQDIGLH